MSNFYKAWLAVFILFISVVFSQAVTFKIAWDAPTNNTDGSTLTDLAGYKVYESTISGSFSVVETNVPFNVMTTTVSAVDAPLSWIGTNYNIATTKNDFTITFDAAGSTNINTYYVATSYNTSQVESAFSSELVLTSSITLLQYNLSWGTIPNQLTNTILFGTTPSLIVARSSLPYTTIHAKPLALYVDGRTNIFPQIMSFNNKKTGKPTNLRIVP